MHKWAVMLALFVFTLPATAARSITVAQLEQRLAANAGKSDAEVAQQLSAFELTERLSTSTLARLESKSPGVKTSQEMKILADRSAFLSLPAAEIPPLPPPDVDSQRKMISLLVDYLTKTLPQLPNFYATRKTTRFEETPLVRNDTHLLPYEPLHQTNAFDVTVLYQNGREVVDAGGGSVKDSRQQKAGLQAWGVFGPILSTVFLDAAKSSLSWSHWEQSPTGPRAVFRYVVPQQKSHYTVNYCCVRERTLGGVPTSFNRIVGYHGEISIDPNEGSILRLTVQANLTPSDPIMMADIMVEYGPVRIGGRTYICATRSVALSRALSAGNVGGRINVAGHLIETDPAASGPLQYLLNDVSFVQYHMFRADARILTNDEASPQDQPPVPAFSSQFPAETAEDVTPPQPSVPSADQQSSAIAASVPTPAKATAVASVSAATPAPSPAEQTQPSAPEDLPVFKTTVRQVMEEVVVTNKAGEPVSGLTQADFEIAEDGKPQKINFFEESTDRTAKSGAPPQMPSMLAGMHTNVPPASPGDAVNVLLIDTLNTEMQDQADVRREVLGFLNQAPSGTPMAIFVLGSKLRCLQGFTSDPSAIIAALRDPRYGLKGQKSSFLETRSDHASDASDLAALQTMLAPPSAIAALQSALAEVGAHDIGARSTMTAQALLYLGHYLAGIPGRKNLIWFSGSFPVAIFPNKEQLARIKKDPNSPEYLDRQKMTSNLFTLSHIAVYPISAEGVSTEHISEADSAGPGAPGGVGHMGGPADSVITPFSAAASDRAATITAMEQLAASTGGKAYYNTNDLGAALAKAIDNGSDYYSIGYSPTNTNMETSFRKIDIKLTHGKDKLAYRRGYNRGDFAAPGAKTSSDPLTPLLHYGLPPTTGILFGVRAEPTKPQTSSPEAFAGQNTNLKGPLTRYTVDFVIRSHDLVLSPGPDGGSTAKFLLGLKAFDRNGNALNWEADDESLSIRPDQLNDLRKRGIPAHLSIDLPSTGDIQLLTAVYDLGSGAAGTLEVELTSGSSSQP